MPYTDLPYSYLEHLWKGIVKVEYSLVNTTSEGLEYGDYTIITINDSRYGNKDNAQLDNYDGLSEFPNEIVLFVRGNEILERMQCTVVKAYKEKEYKKLFQRSIDIHRSLDCKGFILEPVTADATLNVDACLALLQLDNKYSNEVYFKQLGIYAFTSGSQTSNITLRDPRRSVTTAFVASKEKPFIAYVYSKDKTRKFFCDDIGIKVNQDLMENKEELQHSPMTRNSALEILKRRLARGEITMEEYQNVKRIILEDEKYSSNWI
ncbi:MAG: SHOCT domain-containing protein [Nitrososphaeraceae archaeon]